MFHDRAAATGNARSPRLDRLVAGTNRVDVEPDRRRRHASVSDVRCSVSARYCGSWVTTVQTAVGKDTQTELNTLCDLQPMKFSSSRSSGVMWSELLAENTSTM